MSETQRASLHIGVNVVDPQRYTKLPDVLFYAEADAEAMQRIALSRGFETKVLLSKEATRAVVLEAIGDIANRLRRGDFFFLTYAGHGGQVTDKDGDELKESGGKPDKMDETWLLYDTQLLDDEIFAALTSFAPGVRVFFMSDSCHSGTVARGDVDAKLEYLDANGAELTVRWARPDVTFAEYADHREEYTARAAAGGRASLEETEVKVILLSGCQDRQVSLDGEGNGAFTTSFLQAWGADGFTGDYNELWQVVTDGMRGLPLRQEPNLFPYGVDVESMLKTTPLGD
jgi:hypothetical protein